MFSTGLCESSRRARSLLSPRAISVCEALASSQSGAFSLWARVGQGVPGCDRTGRRHTRSSTRAHRPELSTASFGLTALTDAPCPRCRPVPQPPLDAEGTTSPVTAPPASGSTPAPPCHWFGQRLDVAYAIDVFLPLATG